MFLIVSAYIVVCFVLIDILSKLDMICVGSMIV